MMTAITMDAKSSKFHQYYYVQVDCYQKLVTIRLSHITKTKNYISQNKKSNTSPPGLEPGIFWFVARRRDHWATRNKYYIR